MTRGTLPKPRFPSSQDKTFRETKVEQTVFVADAHALAWYFTDDPRLGHEAARVFERAESGEYPILIPTIVLAELFHIGRKKRIDLDFTALLRKIEEMGNFMVADVQEDKVVFKPKKRAKVVRPF